jgi:hypothetical protein
MGESAVMIHQEESAGDELLVERFEIVDTEQPGESESEGESADGGDSGEDEERKKVIWEGDPKKK